MSCYDVLYMLRPVREVEPGWWKLRWRPIWRHTFSIYRSRTRWFFGVWAYRTDANNGWHRSYKHLTVRFGVPLITFEVWFRWDFVVHKDGPSDVRNARPIIIPESEAP